MMGKIPPVPGAERTAGPAVAGPVSGAERTVGRAAAVPGAGTGPARQVTPIALAITLTTALALFLRLWQLTKHGYLLGPTEYDDGVYFGSALRLIHGAVPYKDFVTVQPPGVMLVMTSAALFAGALGTAKALFIGRLLTACAGAAGVTLTGLLIRHRGALAVAAAGENALNGAGKVPAVQRVWLSALSRAQYVWLSGLWERRMPWTPPIGSYFNAHFRLVRADASGRVYQRGGQSYGKP